MYDGLNLLIEIVPLDKNKDKDLGKVMGQNPVNDEPYDNIFSY